LSSKPPTVRRDYCIAAQSTVTNLQIENFLRSRPNSPKPTTLTLNNRKTNRLAIRGLDEQQLR
jgi:hypothetical protein